MGTEIPHWDPWVKPGKGPQKLKLFVNECLNNDDQEEKIVQEAKLSLG